MCKDISCLIVRQLEVQNLGVRFLSLVTLMTVLCASASFVDDTDMVDQGENVICDMQNMLNTHNKYHKATGGQIQESKTSFFS